MTIAVSVVSHGHQIWIRQLLQLISDHNNGEVIRVWLTINKPEPLFFVKNTHYSFELKIIQNPSPRGYGFNHNQAFKQESLLEDSAHFFAVVNPDISWVQSPWPHLLDAAKQSGEKSFLVPVQMSENNERQDFEREWPTFRSMLKRYLNTKKRQSHQPKQVDWVNGAFLFFPAALYQALGGFSERYRMYCEDVDLCLRARLQGFDFQVLETVSVRHAAQRRTFKQLHHLIWHLQSLCKLWASPEWGKRHTIQCFKLQPPQ